MCIPTIQHIIIKVFRLKFANFLTFVLLPYRCQKDVKKTPPSKNWWCQYFTLYYNLPFPSFICSILWFRREAVINQFIWFGDNCLVGWFSLWTIFWFPIIWRIVNSIPWAVYGTILKAITVWPDDSKIPDKGSICPTSKL